MLCQLLSMGKAHDFSPLPDPRRFSGMDESVIPYSGERQPLRRRSHRRATAISGFEKSGNRIRIKFSSSTVKCIIPHTSNSFFLVLAAAFFGLVACLLSASCLRIDGRGLRILTSRRSSLLIMAYTPCRSFMLVKHRDLI